MLTANLNGLTLLAGWFEDDPTYRCHVAFPLYKSTGTRETTVVYMEVEPGEALREHTDSREEVLLVLTGTVEVAVGNERAVAGPGAMVVVPERLPHGFRNIGTERARLVGFFAGAQVESTFPVPIQPLGHRSGGAPPIPHEAPLTWNQIAAMLTAPQDR
jgi:quercetin dioxygenase-like cupin family protein